MPDEQSLAVRSDPADPVQDRGRHGTVATAPVMGDREAVGFVPDPLKQQVRFRVGLEVERRG